MPHLIMHRGGHTQQFEVKTELTIGRSSENTIRIPTAKASRRHCRIVASDGGCILEDLGSSNGTRHNGSPVTGKVTLQNKDTIEIGGLVLTFLDADDDPLVGTRLGKYHILEPLGKGGMGAVYRARQIPINRDVALKVLNPALVSRKGFVESFQREARLAASLQHPNIIGIHDYGSEGDWYYFSMEFVDGENLLDRMARQGPLIPDEIVAFGTQVCEALDHAHGKHILHQDVKPHNIMVDKESVVKVADLGLANVMQYSAEADEERVSMGTPQYVAPEVIRRRAPDARTDLYSLSATLYHLITGTIPFDAKTLKDMLQCHIKDPVPDPRDVIPQIPAPLADLIMRGLSKDPARRPESAAVYGGLLRAALRNDRTMPKAKPVPGAMPVAAGNNVRVMSPETETRGTRALTPVSELPRVGMQSTNGEEGRVPRSSDSTRTSRMRGSQTKRMSFLLPAVLVLLVLGAGGWLAHKTGVFRPASEQEAEKDLLVAQRIHASDPAQARPLFERILRRYPNTPAAREARTMLAQAAPTPDARPAPELAQELDAIDSEYEAGWLGRAEARSRLNTLLAQAGLDPESKARAQAMLATFAPDDADAGGDSPLALWAEMDGIVSRLIEQQRFGDARTMILQFQRNHPDSDVMERTEQRLRGLDAILARGESTFNEAQAALERGEPAQARRLYIRILRDLPGTEWADRAREGQSRLDGVARERFFAGWQSFLEAVGRLDSEAAEGMTRDLSAQLEGSAWQDPAVHLVRLAHAMSQFDDAVVRTVARAAVPGSGRGALQVRVRGAGLVTLSTGRDGTLHGTDDAGEAHPVAVSAIELDDLPTLVPPLDLTEEQALGAALYAFVRNDPVLARTYLARVEEGGTYDRLRRAVTALSQNRAMSELFTFAREERSHEAWHPTPASGPWSFEADRLTAATDTPSEIRLTGRRFALKDFALSIDLQAEKPTGQAGVVLSQDERQYLAFWVRGETVTLQAGMGGRTERSEGRAGGDPWRLEIRDGRAVLFCGEREAATLAVPGTAEWEVEVRLDFTDTPGRIEWLGIEEGDTGAGTASG